MKKVTIGEDYRIETFDLDEAQHQIAVDLVVNNRRVVQGYTLDEVDDDILDGWIEQAEDECDDEYAQFLSDAKKDCSIIYTLNDHLGEFEQPIGEVAVYDI